jgi:hypothetical protein
MGQVVIIGDIGGHVDALNDALSNAGVDVDNHLIQDGMTVIQVGDLIHRGPASDQVVATVDAYLTNNPGRWIQLAGNHEANYLFPATFRWNETISDTAQATLQRWWNTGQMQLAAAVTTGGIRIRRSGGDRTVIGAGDLLVTHAGLTAGMWHQLGQPDTAADAAAAINAQRYNPNNSVWDAGSMLYRVVNHNAGPVWAEAGGEVFGSWLAHLDVTGDSACPGFHQAHGHTTPFNWYRGIWRVGAERQRGEMTANADRRHVRYHIGEQVVWCVDPNHDREPATRWQPLVLDTHAHTS